MKAPTLFETMTPEEFRARRRQKYLNLEYYRLNQKDLDESIKGQLELIERDKAEGDPSPSGQSGVFGYKLDLLKLHYTAGEPIEELKPYYAEVLKAWKVYLDAHAKYVLYLEKKFGDELEKTKPPLIFEDVECFRQVMELVSLVLLLGDGVALRQLVHDFRYYRHTDMLYEALIAPAVPDPDKETTEYFHEVPYSPLIDAFLVGTTQEEAGASIRQYLKSWYRDGTMGIWMRCRVNTCPITATGLLMLPRLQSCTTSTTHFSAVIFCTQRILRTGHGKTRAWNAFGLTFRKISKQYPFFPFPAATPARRQAGGSLPPRRTAGGISRKAKSCRTSRRITAKPFGNGWSRNRKGNHETYPVKHGIQKFPEFSVSI
jgi:hypothetical protein